MNFISVLNQASVLFILLIIGFITKKAKILTDDLGKGLSNLVIYVTLPALLITSMNYEFSQEMFQNSMQLFVLGPVIYLLMIGVGVLYTKVTKTKEPQKSIYQAMLIFSNVGFMGYPIVEIVYGKIGVFYAALYNIWFNIFLWTLGITLTNPKHNEKFRLKSLINPGTVSVGIGFILFIFSIQLPKPVYTALNQLGATTTPLAMMLVGSLLGDAKWKDVFGNKKLYSTAIMRLIALPAIIFLVLSLFDLPDMVLGIPVIIAAMPVAANVAIFSRKYDSDYELASKGVFLTTMLSIVTIPMVIYVIARI